MECATSRPDRRSGGLRSGRSRPLLLTLGVATAISLLAGCSDDGGDEVTDGTVAVDEDFPGDALDATCARLEAAGADGEDRVAVATALLDELSEVADPALVVSTLEMAVIDRCPDWADAVDAAVRSRP